MPTINPQAVRGPVTAIPVVAGTGVRFREDVENNMVVAEVDETVLYTSSTGETTLQLNESLTNFERIRFKIYTDQGYAFVERQVSTGTNLVLSWCSGYTNAWIEWMLLTYNSATNVLTVDHVKGLSNVFANNTTTLGSHLDQSAQMKGIREIVGINRVASA